MLVWVLEIIKRTPLDPRSGKFCNFFFLLDSKHPATSSFLNPLTPEFNLGSILVWNCLNYTPLLAVPSARPSDNNTVTAQTFRVIFHWGIVALKFQLQRLEWLSELDKGWVRPICSPGNCENQRAVITHNHREYFFRVKIFFLTFNHKGEKFSAPYSASFFENWNLRHDKKNEVVL